MLRRFEASPSRCPRLMGMASSGRERGALAIVRVRSRRVSSVAVRPGEGPLTELTAGVQPAESEQVLMPQGGHAVPRQT